MNWIFGIYGIVMTAFSLYISGIGLWGIIKKRPLLFPARQLMWFLISMYIPSLIQSFVPLFESWGRKDPFFVISPTILLAMMILLVFIFWRQMTGYMIFGTNDDTFRDALISALNKLNLPFQETISKIKLTSLDADLQAAVASWMGTAQIRIKQRQHAHYTKEIANAMNEYYKNNVVKVNNIAFVLYLLLGILLLVFVVVMVGFGSLFRF